MSKISGLFSRRSFNIDSLAVGSTNEPGISRITIVANGDEYVVEQLEKQLNKLIPVIKVKRFVMGEYISRELILIKVHASSAKRFEIIKIAELMGAKIVDVAQNTLTIEYCETTEQIKTLLDLLKPFPSSFMMNLKSSMPSTKRISTLLAFAWREILERASCKIRISST